MGCEGQADPESPSCVMGCPSRPLARKPHAAYLKEAKAQPVRSREAAARLARQAAQSGKSYHELLAEGTQYASKQDWRRAARACREAIALAPDEPVAYAALGGVFLNSKLYTEAAQWYLEAKERSPEGSSEWAVATANAFDLLRQTACDARRRSRNGGPTRSSRPCVGEGCEGGACRCGSQPNAGVRAERAVCCVGGGAALVSGVQGGGCTLRASCGRCAAAGPAPALQA